MQYIVVDLEWNQPVSYNSAVYRRVGDSLMFEVIQFGAVKLSEELQVVDSVSIPVRPTQYTSIHPRVRRMTHLGREELADAPVFLDAMEQFAQWCGEDYVLLTWGCDDISVLKQNIDFFGYEGEMPRFFDIQRHYAQVMGLGASQKGLKSAMEQLEIQPDEERSFHNALDDAYYTALVFQKLPHPEKALEHEQTARKLCHSQRATRMRVTHMVRSVKEGLESEAVRTPVCPTCKKPTALQTELIVQAPGKYVALSKCAQHGVMFVKLCFTLMPDGQKGMRLSVLPANRQNKAYVHTKELQYQYKKKRGDFDHADIEVVDGARGSNMPFEDV